MYWFKIIVLMIVQLILGLVGLYATLVALTGKQPLFYVAIVFVCMLGVAKLQLVIWDILEKQQRKQTQT